MSDLSVGAAIQLSTGSSGGSGYRTEDHEGNVHIALSPERIDVNMQYSNSAARCKYLVIFEAASKPPVAYVGALVLPAVLQDRILGAASPAVIFVPRKGEFKSGNTGWMDTFDQMPNAEGIKQFAQEWLNANVTLGADGTLELSDAIMRVVDAAEEPAGNAFPGDFPAPAGAQVQAAPQNANPHPPMQAAMTQVQAQPMAQQAQVTPDPF